MKHGKDMRDPRGRPRDPNAAKEVPGALMFVMVEISRWRGLALAGQVIALRRSGSGSYGRYGM
jgi:hypothetical protein